MAERVTSGIDRLDTVLGGGLMLGDNVVWLGGDGVHHLLQRALLMAAPAGAVVGPLPVLLGLDHIAALDPQRPRNVAR